VGNHFHTINLAVHLWAQVVAYRSREYALRIQMGLNIMKVEAYGYSVHLSIA